MYLRTKRMPTIVRSRLHTCDARIGSLSEAVLRDGIGDTVLGALGHSEWMYWLGLELMLRCCNVGSSSSGTLTTSGTAMLCCSRRCSSTLTWFSRLALSAVMSVSRLREAAK